MGSEGQVPGSGVRGPPGQEEEEQTAPQVTESRTLHLLNEGGTVHREKRKRNYPHI
jgi:hypothetical protein